MHLNRYHLLLAAVSAVSAAQATEYKSYVGHCANAGCTNVFINNQAAQTPAKPQKPAARVASTPVRPAAPSTPPAKPQKPTVRVASTPVRPAAPSTPPPPPAKPQKPTVRVASTPVRPTAPRTPTPPPLILIAEPAEKAAHMEVDLRWSESGGNGRRYPLENNSQLYSGDEFTIDVRSHKTAWVYLIQFDSHGQAQDLMAASGYPNRIDRGEFRQLPKAKPNGTTRHFYLDSNPGTETLHLLVANHPLDNIVQQYRQGLLTASQLDSVKYKGVIIADDRIASSEGRQMLSCQNTQLFCTQSFRIEHLPGKRW
jgi:hypothetical protein